MLKVRLIGGLAISYDGEPVTIPSRAAQSLFAYLILTAGRVHRREKLAGMFWPNESEEKGRANLRHELWRIRKTFAPAEVLVSNDIGIAFSGSANYWLDAALLEQLTDVASADELIAALSAVQGDFLPGFYDEWIALEREHFEATYERKMARLLELLEIEKRWSEILDWAERWIAAGNGPESAYRALIVAYDALGDRPKATATYKRCEKALRELDLEPSEQTRALVFKRTSKLNIPIPLTSFIGREKELQEVVELFSKSRLVTLTGSGGVGKTRLAIQVVADLLERFPDGTWFLDLAPLSDPALVPNTLANVFGLRETGESSLTDLLISYFRSRTALIIFDNCEHLVESCAQLVQSLLISCENLSILATSREALRVSGELPYRVPSMESPEPDIQFNIDELSNMESLRLFTERAAIISPGLRVNQQNALAIVQICQRLDGIPLAIELAAARVNVLTVEQIAKRLDDRFNLLTGGLRSAMPRHQTLRATIEWSYDLLSAQERLLFTRLAVFRGGWTLEAAEQVCSGSGIQSSDILELLSQLVSKSLVAVDTSNDIETRYRRLETIRQFAREKLMESAESARFSDRHLDYVLKKAEELEPFLTGPGQSACMEYLELELDNIRLALEWAILSKKGEESLRIFGALGWFWLSRCHMREGREWFQRAMQLRNAASKRAQASALRSAGFLYWEHQDDSAAMSVLSESLALYRELGDLKEISNGLQFLGVQEAARENIAAARKIFEECMDISSRVDNKIAIARSLMHFAGFSVLEGEYAAAWRQFEDCLTICRQVQDDHLTTVALQNFGTFALDRQNNIKARDCFTEALTISLRSKDKRNTVYSLLGVAGVLCAEGHYSQSARLLGFSVNLLSETEARLETGLEYMKKTANIMTRQVDENSYQKEFESGKALLLEQAVEIALKVNG